MVNLPVIARYRQLKRLIALNTKHVPDKSKNNRGYVETQNYEQLDELLPSLGLCISPIIFRLVGEMLCVQCYQSVYHTVSSFLELK